MTQLCICMICTCGRHKCPHFPKGVVNKDKVCTITEYANKYKQHPIEMAKSFKPEPQPMQNGDPLQDETTHRKDYIKHPLGTRYQHQGETYRPPEGEFDPTTNYNKDFTKKKADPVKAIKKEAGPRTLGKFEGEPTYKRDYRKWSASMREKIVRDDGYAPNEARFAGTPTYQHDYIKHPMAFRQSMKPDEGAKASDAPFDGKTGYRDEFIKHPLAQKEQKEKPKWAPNPAKLDGLSNYKKDYIAKEAEKMASCKPDPNPYQSNAQFEDETTQRHDYVKKHGDRPYVHKQEDYVRPEGDMFMNTTHQADFTKKPIDRQMAKKPISVNKNPGEFRDATNYKEDFRKWPMGERPMITMRSDYVPTDAAFSGTPTYKRDYIKHPYALRQSMKPDENAKASDAPFDGKTGYRDEFIKHPIEAKEKKEKVAWAPNPSKLDGLSNYMKDYIPKDAGKMASCKPDPNPYQSNAQFEDETTHRHDFVKKHGDRPYVHKQEEYVRPEGEMSMNTTHKLEYTKKQMEKVAARKPSSAKREPGKFYDKTNYREDFRKLSGIERVKVPIRADYVPNEAPFEGDPTYRRDYVKYNAAPVHSLKPNDTGYQSEAPFEGTTEYKVEYIKKAAPPCPVVVLNKGGSTGLEFVTQDDTGHKWYRAGASQPLKPLSATCDFKPPTPVQTKLVESAAC